MTIPFEVPNQYIHQLNAGSLERFGPLLKDTATGQIVAHLQETGALKSFLGAAGHLSPVNAGFGIANTIQNEQIKSRLTDISGKLDVMTGTLGQLKALQIVNLLLSLVGIGVTVACTVYISRRLSEIDQKLDGLLAAIEQINHHDLKRIHAGIMTHTERMKNLEDHPNPKRVVHDAERVLDENFDLLFMHLREHMTGNRINAKFMGMLMSDMLSCGAMQINAAIWLNAKQYAKTQANDQFKKFMDVSRMLPRTRLDTQLKGQHVDIDHASLELSEMRRRFAAMPVICNRLIEMDIDGREYIEQVLSEKKEPFLVLPMK
ncbi:MAG: hypothetical protein OXB95_01370 [Rhodobacteraceae bacterium]|nr:hypothetical protein [Paracoccaceae bacterium]